MLREICGDANCDCYLRPPVHPMDGGEARTRRSGRWVWTIALVVLIAAMCGGVARADEPFAPTREYALQNARIELRFDLDQRKIMGQVTHTVAALHEGLRQLDFDSVGLDISSVRVNGRDAHFSTDASKLHVDLERPSTSRRKV